MKKKKDEWDFEKISNLFQKKEGYFFIAGFIIGLIFGAIPAMWIALGIATLCYFWFKKKNGLKEVLKNGTETNK